MVADHGSGGRVGPPGAAPRAGFDTPSLIEEFSTIHGNAIPLVLVKPAGASGALKTSMSPVTLGDLPNTAMELIGAPQSFPGVSMFAAIDPARERFTYGKVGGDDGELREFSIKGDVFDVGAWALTGRGLEPAAGGRK